MNGVTYAMNKMNERDEMTNLYDEGHFRNDGRSQAVTLSSPFFSRVISTPAMTSSSHFEAISKTKRCRWRIEKYEIQQMNHRIHIFSKGKSYGLPTTIFLHHRHHPPHLPHTAAKLTYQATRTSSCAASNKYCRQDHFDKK